MDWRELETSHVGLIGAWRHTYEVDFVVTDTSGGACSPVIPAFLPSLPLKSAVQSCRINNAGISASAL